MDPRISQFTPDHPLWVAYLAHLAHHNMARWVLADDQQPLPDYVFLGAVTGEQHVIGHLSLHIQPIMVPKTEWSAGRDHVVTGPDGTVLRETFVATFAVDVEHRRRGTGRALQQAALDLTRVRGCYQMRSWSSLDNAANYALKLSMGFAVHPAIQLTPAGKQISGVYFVKVTKEL